MPIPPQLPDTPIDVIVEKQKRVKEKKDAEKILSSIFRMGSGFIKWSFVVFFLLAALFVLLCFLDLALGKDGDFPLARDNFFWDILNGSDTAKNLLEFLFTKLAPILLLLPFTFATIFIIIIIGYYAICTIGDEHNDLLKYVKKRIWTLIALITKALFDAFTSILESVQLAPDFVKSVINLVLYLEDE